MNWINSGAFKIANRNGRHYVFRRNNSGNTEINIPASISTKAQAKRWLKNNPNKVKNPAKFRPKKVVLPGLSAFVPTYFGGNVPMQQRPMGLGSPKYFNLDLPCDKFKTSLTEIKAIGSGRQGKVFKVTQGNRGDFALKISPYDLVAKSRGEPQPFETEFKNQKAIMDIVPQGVVFVYKTFRCLNFVKNSEIDMKNVQNSAKYDKARQGIIVMEYCDGGSLADWIKKNPLSDSVFQKIISQIVGTLVEIRKTYPHFNHNDLHMENIFVSTTRGFLIGDFGWSRVKANGTNPAVNTANGTATASFWGVGPKTDPRYDVHFFLNEFREWILRHDPAKYPRTMAFLDRVVPTGYRGINDTHVSEFRLKYGDPCPGLPTLTTIARDTYIKGGISVSNLLGAKTRLRKVKLPSPKKLESIVLRPKRRITSPMLRGAIAKLKKVRPTNKKDAELLAMSAANFMKLSPKTRERAKKLREKKKVAALLSLPKNKKVVKPNAVPNVKKSKVVPKEILKSNKFNKLVEKIWKAQGGQANESFYNSWNRARTKALNQVANRLSQNKPPFTPSPPKAKAKNFNYKLSPSSGRAKIRAPESGRYVYANGSTISLDYLKGIATMMGVDIKGLRSKADIAKRIFSVKNK